MSLQEYTDKMKKIQSQILEFLEDEEASEENFKTLLTLLSISDRYELKLILLMISKISNNHHRCLHFFTKIERILGILFTENKNMFSNTEIFNIFKNNKRILL